MTVRDLVTTAVFTVVYLLVIVSISLTLGMIPVVYPFIIAIGSVPCGIVWAFLRVKVPKRYCILMQCGIQAIVMFLIGSGWFIASGVLAGAVAAELVSAFGGYRSFKAAVVAYAAYALCFHAGSFAIVMLARDYYLEYCVSSGMDPAYMETLLGFMSWEVFGVSSLLAVIGAVVGMLLGRLFLHKHFLKAGVV
jgi:energy-coupling factor transport system substrate-specific component